MTHTRGLMLAMETGRAWSASELRLKSLEELHALWFVLLRERNKLNSEREAARSQVRPMAAPHRLEKTRKSMARIKRILGERPQAVESARLLLRPRADAKRELQSRIDAVREAFVAGTAPQQPSV